MQFNCKTVPVCLLYFCSGYHYGLLSGDIFQLPPILQLDILKAKNSLRPSQSVAIDGSPGTIINGCSTKFAPLLKYI